MTGTRSRLRHRHDAERAVDDLRNGLLASLDGFECGLARLRRRTLAVGLGMIAVAAADLAAILAARP